MDRVRTRILVRVAAKNGENPFRRRGKGSLAMFVSQGLVDPKTSLNRSRRKGSRLIFLHYRILCPYPDRSRYLEYISQCIQAPKPSENRNGEKEVNA